MGKQYGRSDDGEIHRLQTGYDTEQRAPLQMRQARGSHEADTQWAGFLLWTLQLPGRRNRNHVAKIVHRSKSTLTQWSVRYNWKSRANFPDAEFWAGQLLQACFPHMLLKALDVLPELKALRKLVEHAEKNHEPAPQATDEQLDDVADAADEATKPTPIPTPISTLTADTLPPKAEQALPQRGSAELRAVKGVARAIVQQTGKKVVDGNYELHVRDFFSAAKVLLALEGLPTEVVQHIGQGSTVESVRVRQAKSNGASPVELLRARRDDLVEVMTAIDQTLLQEEVADIARDGTVLQFPTATTTQE